MGPFGGVVYEGRALVNGLSAPIRGALEPPVPTSGTWGHGGKGSVIHPNQPCWCPTSGLQPQRCDKSGLSFISRPKATTTGRFFGPQWRSAGGRRGEGLRRAVREGRGGQEAAGQDVASGKSIWAGRSAGGRHPEADPRSPNLVLWAVRS